MGENSRYEIYTYPITIINNHLPLCALHSSIHTHHKPRQNSKTASSHGRGLRTGWPNAAVPFATVAAPISKRDGVEPSKAIGLLGVDHALGGRVLVSSTVVAVRVLHVLVPEAGHFRYLLACDGS